MKCFNHRDLEAIGVCRNCNKNVCENCLLWHEQPIGLVCSEPCKERIETLLNAISGNERDRSTVHEQIRTTELLKQKTAQLYMDMARGEKRGFILASLGSFGLYAYSFMYAKFFDWYFSFSLGSILLVYAFVLFHRAEAFKKFAGDEE